MLTFLFLAHMLDARQWTCFFENARMVDATQCTCLFEPAHMVDATQCTFLLRFLQKIEILVGLMHVS